MSAKKKIVFIINPISGVGKKNTIPPLIEKYLDHTQFDFEIQYTQHRGHGHELANTFKKKADAIIAVGGDGSVNEIGSALIGSSCALGIIPCGSGNGLARHIKTPLKFKDAILHINQFKVQTIDTGKVNDRYFLGTCGFGFDAHVAQKFDEYHSRGFWSYIKLVLGEYRDYNAKNYLIHANGTVFKRTAFMCSVANSSQFGNGFTISPLSDISDGTFEFVFLKEFRWYRVPKLAWRFFNRTVHKSDLFESVSFQHKASVELEGIATTTLHLDGEPAESNQRFIIEIRPSSLRVIGFTDIS